MNEPTCALCTKPIHANQARYFDMRLAPGKYVHKKCWEQTAPTVRCWNCLGEGSFKINERQRLPCYTCNGKGVLRPRR